MNTSEIMTIEECAKYLKTSLSTLYKLAQKRKIPVFKLSGQWRFKKDLIDEWIRQKSKIYPIISVDSGGLEKTPLDNLSEARKFDQMYGKFPDEALSLSHSTVRRESMERREELRKTAERCGWVLKDKYKARRVFLIGSLVKGFIHERSDIDLVVEGLSPDLYMKALTELWDLLPSGVELNLIPYEDAFESLKEKAIEGELIYG